MTGPLSLGFDLGGTQVRAALVQQGTVLRRAAQRTDAKGGPEAVMAQFRHLAAEVRAGQDQPVTAIGIAAPGPLDTVAGVVDHIPTLPGWNSFPLRARMSALFGLPVVVENDGIAAAQGEWQHGAGRGVQDMIFATVSTGIGGGIVTDGRLLHGRRGMAAHIGHLRIAVEGPVCACGGVGCFEAFASGTALGHQARARAAGQPASWLGRIAQETEVDARHVVEGARAGDADCMTLIAEEARLLGLGFTSLAHLFSPARIVMGGGISQAFDLLADGIRQTLHREAMAPFRQIPVVAAELGDNAGLIGVASLALAAQD